MNVLRRERENCRWANRFRSRFLVIRADVRWKMRLKLFRALDL
jgi:hypothetical protein